MGKHRIRPERHFVKVVEPYRSPSSRKREWFIAVMFFIGVVASLAAIIVGAVWFAKQLHVSGSLDDMRTIGSMPGAGGPAHLVEFRDIDEELRYLRSLVTEWRATPQIRNLAVQIVLDSGAEPRDKKAQSLAVARWVQDNIYYIHELPERFQTPGETLRLKAGDCDDSTTLVASLIESVGIPSQLVCMIINGSPTHIFPAALMPKTRTLVPLDTTMRSSVHEVVNPIEWAQARGKNVTLKVV